MFLRILVAPSGFKESLEANVVADHIAAGVLRALPSAQVHKAPLVDGGEGFARALCQATGGTIVENICVTGPVGRPVLAHLGLLGGTGPRTVVLEMAAAAGLRLVPTSDRDPGATTTRGVGELIRAALDAGAERILVGCGDSGTCDGGAGMAQALGVRFLDAQGVDLGPGGNELARLDHIDLSKRDTRLNTVRIDVACNWHNVLCGARGVARVFGPQKGAAQGDVERLDAALENYADVVWRDAGKNVRTVPGGGASGGTGAGLSALLGATLHSRYEIVLQYLDIDDLLDTADLVFTAEGGLDEQTPRGKIPAEVATRAKRRGLPVIALAGTLGKNVRVNLDYGIDSYSAILPRPTTLPDAIEHAGEWLENAAEQQMCAVMVGLALAAPSCPARARRAPGPARRRAKRRQRRIDHRSGRQRPRGGAKRDRPRF